MEAGLGIALIAGLFFVTPALGALIGALSGWVVSIICGGWVSSGLLIAGINCQPEQLYLLGAALGFVGGFFRTTVNSKS